MLKTQDIHIRDPYIVVYENNYYLYKSEVGNRIVAYQSDDLENWKAPVTVYTLSADSWGEADLWAPEVHYYQGKYYMFLSLLGKHGLRGTEISVCDTPYGTFVPLTNQPITPKENSCIDGSLYVENDVPYIVYSLDWPYNYDESIGCYVGEIWAMPLTNDLKASAGEPFRLFRANEAVCAKELHYCTLNGETVAKYGSDAPFIYRLSDGRLYLTWSPYPKETYIVAAAIADNIHGKWTHLEEPLFGNHGGHGMFFKDLKGNLRLTLHFPECPPQERALFLNAKEDNGRITLIK